MSDFGNLLWVVVRKPHRCSWCGEEIPPGEECANYRGKWQDEWQNWYMHTECEKAYATDPDIVYEGFTPYENERPRKPEKTVVGL